MITQLFYLPSRTGPDEYSEVHLWKWLSSSLNVQNASQPCYCTRIKVIVTRSWLAKIFCVCCPGDRTNVAGSDLSDILPEEIEAEVKLAAEISMGTEVSEEDIGNIRHLCDQVCGFFFLHRYVKTSMLSLVAELKWQWWWWRQLSFPETVHVGFQSLPHLNSHDVMTPDSNYSNGS